MTPNRFGIRPTLPRCSSRSARPAGGPIEAPKARSSVALFGKGGFTHALPRGDEFPRDRRDVRQLGWSGFTGDPHALRRRSGLGRAALERLAETDTFRSIGLDRRRALWALKALGEPPLPLFAAVEETALPARGLVHDAGRRYSTAQASEARAMAFLPEMPLGEHVVEIT
jgi:hypothetical protein